MWKTTLASKVPEFVSICAFLYAFLSTSVIKIIQHVRATSSIGEGNTRARTLLKLVESRIPKAYIVTRGRVAGACVLSIHKGRGTLYCGTLISGWICLSALIRGLIPDERTVTQDSFSIHPRRFPGLSD